MKRYSMTRSYASFFFYLNLGHVWVYRYRFLADTCVPWVHFVCKATQPGGYTVSFYCYIKKTKMRMQKCRMQKSTEGFFSPLYYERKTLGSICANSLIYIHVIKEKNLKLLSGINIVTQWTAMLISLLTNNLKLSMKLFLLWKLTLLSWRLNSSLSLISMNVHNATSQRRICDLQAQ